METNELIEKAKTQEANGDWQGAVATYRQALQLNPDDLRARYHLGELYRQQGRIDEAEFELEWFMEKASRSEDIEEGRESLGSLTGQWYEKCKMCGCISTQDEFFKSTSRGKLCPRCQSKAGIKNWWLIPAVMLLYMGIGLIFLPVYYSTANFMLILLFNYALILPHELSHAIVGWLTNGRLLEIRIGYGRPFWSKPIRGVVVSLTKYPFAGFCVIVFPTRRLIRLRRFLVVSAGLLLNCLMLLLFLPGFRLERWISTYAIREAFVWANGLHLFFNLIPRRANLGTVQTYSDGGQLLRLLGGEYSAAQLHLGHFLQNSVYALRQNAYDRVVEICEEGLALYPDETLLRSSLAVALLEQGEHDEALAIFRDLMARYDDDEILNEAGITEENRDLLHAVAKNNVAYAMLFTDTDPDAISEARKYARQAYRMIPWVSTIQNTWGSVLIEIGEADEGVHHLLQALEQCDTDKEEASTLAFIAIGYHRLGESQKAQDCLLRAIELAPDHYAVEKARTDIEMT